jgi:hypothetical protein
MMKMKCLLVIAVLLVLLGIVTAGTASAAPIQWASNGHWYEFIEYGSALSWTEALADAVSKGGYLATLTTAPEDSWVYTNVVVPARAWHTGEYGPWLGGYQLPGSPEPAGGWTWVNGDGAFSYANWNGGEPNNSGSGENVMHMFMPVSTGGWNDVPDNEQYSFNSYVLEKNPAGPGPDPVVPEPMSLLLGIMGLSSVAGFRKLRRK